MKNVLLVVRALFPIVNPIGDTSDHSLADAQPFRAGKSGARMVARNGLILTIASIFIGAYILAAAARASLPKKFTFPELCRAAA